jgi:hypothetical protein
MTKATATAAPQALTVEAVTAWLVHEDNAEAAHGAFLAWLEALGVPQTGISATVGVLDAFIRIVQDSEIDDEDGGNEEGDGEGLHDADGVLIEDAETIDITPEMLDDSSTDEGGEEPTDGATEEEPVADEDVPQAPTAEDDAEPEAEEGEEPEAEEGEEPAEDEGEGEEMSLLEAIGVDDDAVKKAVNDMGGAFNKRAKDVLKAMDLKLPDSLKGKKASDAERLDFIGTLVAASEALGAMEFDDLKTLSDELGCEIKSRSKKADKLSPLMQQAILTVIADDLGSVEEA